MDYVILIYSDENVPAPAPGSPGFDEYLQGWMGYNAALHEAGAFVAGAGLAPTATATTVHNTAGQSEATVTDGPFAETKEQLGGFYMISAENLDAALAWARRLPLPEGSVEVRPVAFRGDQL